jgi:ATP synthase protein I
VPVVLIIRRLFRRAQEQLRERRPDEVIAALVAVRRAGAIESGKNVIAIDVPKTGQPGMGQPNTGQPNPRRLALRVALGQAVVALIAALLCWVIADSRAALSAALGGGISSAASLVMALLSFGSGASKDPLRAIRAFFVGEAAKVIVVIVLFVVVLKTMKVVPLAMLGAYIATFFVFWVALARGSSVRGIPRADDPSPRAGE